MLLSQSLPILTILFCLGLFLQLCCCCYLTKLLFRGFLQFKLSNFIGHSLKPCHHLFNVKFPLFFLLWKFSINLSWSRLHETSCLIYGLLELKPTFQSMLIKRALFALGATHTATPSGFNEAIHEELHP